jgi:hypothetical protein
LDSGILRPHGAVANGTASATSVSTASSFITTTSRLLFTGPSAALTSQCLPVPISACKCPSVLASAYQSSPVLASPRQCPSVTIQKAALAPAPRIGTHRPLRSSGVFLPLLSWSPSVRPISRTHLAAGTAKHHKHRHVPATPVTRPSTSALFCGEAPETHSAKSTHPGQVGLFPVTPASVLKTRPFSSFTGHPASGVHDPCSLDLHLTYTSDSRPPRDQQLSYSHTQHSLQPFLTPLNHYPHASLLT